MTRSRRLSRRRILRGLGTAISLPWLEAMVPVEGFAAGPERERSSPRRMAFLYVPNGVQMRDWTPSETGERFTFSRTLKPLEPFKDDLLILSGLAQRNAEPFGDGGGDHARSLACFLTGAHALKTDGANIRAGISIDQIAAQKIGWQTRLPSLELGIERGAQSGDCDSGYSCAYSSNISWKSANMPMAKEINPKHVFDRMFGSRSRQGSTSERARRELYQKSILDFVLDDARRLDGHLGVGDRRKLDEYLTSVREIEQRIARFENADNPPPPGLSRPDGIPQDLSEHIRLMLDLLALSFQSDVTRVCTFMFANEPSNRSYPFIDVSDGHHDLSHHGNDPKKQEKLRAIDRFHVEQFAYLLGKLGSIREGDGSLLDSVMIVYGSGISDGDRHNHDDLPILLAGKGGGTIKPGRHLRYNPQPLSNLFLSMLDRMSLKIDRHGDSTGRLPKLDG